MRNFDPLRPLKGELMVAVIKAKFMLCKIEKSCFIVEGRIIDDMEEQKFGYVKRTAPSPFGEGDGGCGKASKVEKV